MAGAGGADGRWCGQGDGAPGRARARRLTEAVLLLFCFVFLKEAILTLYLEQGKALQEKTHGSFLKAGG